MSSYFPMHERFDRVAETQKLMCGKRACVLGKLTGPLAPNRGACPRCLQRSCAVWFQCTYVPLRDLEAPCASELMARMIVDG
eukprot:2869802-Amphidinium_carterae.1